MTRKFQPTYFAVLLVLIGWGTAIAKPLPFSERQRAYIGLNPLAIPAALNLEDNLKRYVPEVSGVEYGLAVFGGCLISPRWAAETRLSLGNVNKLAFVGQLHAGGYYFLPSGRHDFYAGGFLKFWDYYNRLTEIHFLNLAPYAVIGYQYNWPRFFVDIRLNQTIAIFSASTLEHSSPGASWFFSPWPGFMPIMPALSFGIGYRF